MKETGRVGEVSRGTGADALVSITEDHSEAIHNRQVNRDIVTYDDSRGSGEGSPTISGGTWKNHHWAFQFNFIEGNWCTLNHFDFLCF